ncbi:MAG: hypothetical protein PVI23_13020, partial [Maricaulaceae bacterium]
MWTTVWEDLNQLVNSGIRDMQNFIAGVFEIFDDALPGDGLFNYSIAALLFAVFFSATRFIQSVLINPHDRGTEKLARWLRQGGPVDTYRATLKSFLSWISLRLAKDDNLRASGYSVSWSGRLFDRLLLLSFIYPIISAVLVWSVFGYAGPAGEAIGLVQDPPPTRRIVFAILLLIALIVVLRGLPAKGDWRVALVATTFAAAGAFAFAGSIAFAMAFIIAFFITALLSNSIAGCVALSGSITFALIAFAIPIESEALNYALSIFGGVAFAVVIAVIFSYAYR